MPRVKMEDWTTEDGLLKIKGWARNGLTDKEIAKNIGIDRTTLYRWGKKNCNICNTIKKERETVAIEVEDCFIKECKGYYTTEKTIEEFPDGTIKKKIVEKWNRPNTTALIFYLKNNIPERYGDVKEDNTTIAKVDELLKGLNDAAFENAEGVLEEVQPQMEH